MFLIARISTKNPYAIFIFNLFLLQESSIYIKILLHIKMFQSKTYFENHPPINPREIVFPQGKVSRKTIAPRWHFRCSPHMKAIIV